jgi:hypothetical protein
MCWLPFGTMVSVNNNTMGRSVLMVYFLNREVASDHP